MIDALPQMMLAAQVERPSEGLIFGKMMVIGWPERDRLAPLVIWNIAAIKAQLRHEMVDPTLPPIEVSCRLRADRLVGCSRSGIDARTWTRGYLPILDRLQLDHDYVQRFRSTPKARIVVQITFADDDCPLTALCTEPPPPPPPLVG